MSDIHFGYWIFIAFMVGTLLFSIVCNLSVIYVMLTKQRFRDTASNILVCNLAFSDLVLSMFGIPVKMHDISHTDNFHEGQFICKMVNFIPVLSIMSSVYSFLAISVERYRAVVQHNTKAPLTIRSCYLIIVSIWIASWLVTIPTIVEFSENEVDSDGNHTTVSCDSSSVPHGFSVFNGIFLALVSYVIPLIVITTNYTRIAFFLSRRAKDASDATKGMVIHRNRVKIVKMMIIVTVLFAVSWAPYFVVLIISKVTGESGSEDSAGPLALVMITLSTFSTAYNVVLYVIFNTNFRRALKATFCYRRFRVAPENQSAQTVQPTAVPS